MLKFTARLTALLGLVALVPLITLYARSAAPAASQSGAAAIGGYCSTVHKRPRRPTRATGK